MITAGFDVGARFAKVCIVRDGELAGAAMAEINQKVSRVIRRIYGQALDHAGIRKWRVRGKAVTGYGAGLVKIRGAVLSRTRCSAAGVHFLDPEARTVVDVGGIFASITALDETGRPTASASNEKCAAGGGKFLEMVCAALETPLDAVSEHAAQARSPYTISSNCAVFAESEVITQVNIGRDSADILAGVLDLIAARTATLFDRVQARAPVVLVGGLAKTPAFAGHLERRSGFAVGSPGLDPQLAGALGAALLAAEG